MNNLVCHITRGTINPVTVDAARDLHNAFLASGTPPGIDVAQSLGDVSHAAYLPVDAVTDATTPGELLFLDAWADAEAMERFFADPLAKQASERLYSTREESEWWPASGAFSFHLPAPVGTPEPVIAVLRTRAPAERDAIAALSTLVRANLGVSRRRGQLSHEQFARTIEAALTRPASNARHHATAHAVDGHVEVLVVDTWSTRDGLAEHYADLAAEIGATGTVTEPVDATIWTRAPASFNGESNGDRRPGLGEDVDNRDVLRKPQ